MRTEPSTAELTTTSTTTLANLRGADAARLIDVSVNTKKQGKEKQPDKPLVSLVFPG